MKQGQFIKAVEILSRSSKHVSFIASHEVTKVHDDGHYEFGWSIMLTHGYRDIIVELISEGYDIQAETGGIRIFCAEEA